MSAIGRAALVLRTLADTNEALSLADLERRDRAGTVDGASHRPGTRNRALSAADDP